DYYCQSTDNSGNHPIF
nr:immunoglobulin light chain junction region [Macaca mulatta]MOY08066.1 immunoglobulin light chain junction region [Macaca mulatta]